MTNATHVKELSEIFPCCVGMQFAQNYSDNSIENCSGKFIVNGSQSYFGVNFYVNIGFSIFKNSDYRFEDY